MLPEHVTRLVLPWTLPVKVEDKYHAQRFPPLLDMLQAMVATGLEHTGGGSDPATRAVANLDALDLLAHIEDTSRAWLAEWQVAQPRRLKRTVLLFYLNASISGNDTLAGYTEQWAERIWELHEPPMRLALRGSPCPSCGRSKWQDADNLVVTRKNGELRAECRWLDCRKTWEGVEEVKALGRALGIQFDTDALS